VKLRAPIVAFCAASATLLSSCAGFTRWPWSYTQRWPGPMKAETSPLPPGDRGVFAEGPEEVLVQRHADPVQVRPAGLLSSYPLRFYAKSKSLRAGSSIYTGAGGRAEVLFPEGSSVMLFGTGVGIIGSKSRGEPMFLFQQLDRAHVTTATKETIQLVGGAELRLQGGPVLLESLRADLLRVLNQSKTSVLVAYRDALITLDPGEKVDLPVVGSEGLPKPADSAWNAVEGMEFPVRARGAVEIAIGAEPALSTDVGATLRSSTDPSSTGSVALRALGESSVEALGLEWQLRLDEEVTLRGLESLAPLPTPAQQPSSTPPAKRQP
jgi:hypothetical protein